jgi:tyrosine-protein kinase Etk/Wzc
MHRPVFIGAVSFGTFVAALVALVLAPQQARRAAQDSAPPVAEKPDTMPIAAAVQEARNRFRAAAASLTSARERAASPPAVTPEVPNPSLIARRDSVSSMVSDLEPLLARVETSPLSASYRALGESRALSSNPRVRALLDSLAEVDRDREGFGTSAGADPVFVALTSRATEIGRAIQAVGEQRRDELRAEIVRLNVTMPRQVVATPPPEADTAAWIAERDSAQARITLATSELATARQRAEEFDRRAARARDLANFNAPPIALLAAALVFGVIIGFGAALIDELKRPRVGDEHEVERLTGTRVLATIRPRPPDPERGRRLADRQAPPFFDPRADGYQLTYLHVARTGASRLMLTIAGSETSIAAVLAANLAAIAADEARSTIVIDTDTRTSPVAAALRIHAEPGISDILDGRAEWAEAVAAATIGRDRVIDVIPSGIAVKGRSPSEVTALFRREVARLSRHYEAIVVVATPEQVASGLPGVLPIPDTILCARMGHTRIAELQSMLEAVRHAGGNPVGVVVWDSVPPSFPTPEQIARAPRPLYTAEMRALTGARST